MGQNVRSYWFVLRPVLLPAAGVSASRPARHRTAAAAAAAAALLLAAASRFNGHWHKQQKGLQHSCKLSQRVWRSLGLDGAVLAPCRSRCVVDTLCGTTVPLSSAHWQRLQRAWPWPQHASIVSSSDSALTDLSRAYTTVVLAACGLHPRAYYSVKLKCQHAQMRHLALAHHRLNLPTSSIQPAVNSCNNALADCA
jgi:hypothetical protein